MPAALLLTQLPTLKHYGLDVNSLPMVLRQFASLTETSPGMFRAGGRSQPQTPIAELYPIPPSTGAAMEQFLHDNQPIPSADQPRLFKLLVALRTAAKFPDNAIARSALEERVVRERETAEGLQDWRMPDLVRLAEGSVQWVPDSSESIHSQTSKYSLLSSIYALGLVQRTSVETLRARHAELRDRLTMSNVRLVSHYVRPFARGGSMSYADLFQEGAIGLMRAVDRFDPYRGFQFSTMATWWIRQSVTRAMADQERLIRLPVHAVEKLARIRSGYGGFASQDQGALLQEEKLSASGEEMTIANTQEILRADRPVRSLKTANGSVAKDADLAISIELADLRMTVAKVMRQLPWRERRVLELRFGFDDNHELTLQEIANRFGITRERVRQVESRATKHFAVLWETGLRVQRPTGTSALEKAAPDKGEGLDPTFAEGWAPELGWMPAPAELPRAVRWRVNTERARLVRERGRPTTR